MSELKCAVYACYHYKPLTAEGVCGYYAGESHKPECCQWCDGIKAREAEES
jgi:hypothetical protein